MAAVDRKSLVKLLASLSYRKGTFRLASGRESDFYVDVKQTVFRAEGARAVGELLCDRLQAHGITLVGGMAVGAVPLVSHALSAGARGRSSASRCRRRPRAAIRSTVSSSARTSRITAPRRKSTAASVQMRASRS